MVSALGGHGLHAAVTSRQIVPLLPSPSTLDAPSSSFDPASVFAFSEHAGAAHTLCPHGTRRHMYVIGHGTHKSTKSHEIMREHTKTKALQSTYEHMWTHTQGLCCLGSWQSSFSLLPLASIMVQACCQRACIAWGKFPFAGACGREALNPL